MMELKISNEAQNGLEDIWLYTFETWSTEQADHYYNLILDEVECLAKNPASGEDYSQKWLFTIKSKITFYLLQDQQKEGLVEIIRILHQ